MTSEVLFCLLVQLTSRTRILYIVVLAKYLNLWAFPYFLNFISNYFPQEKKKKKLFIIKPMSRICHCK